ncbi:TPA: tellurite resistance TerB family protein [Vibrio cholerae]|uniref:tellurite resistance TerB family protein n=1 Tax=Vibrio cholerae TaxID=666 RepID=UPI00215D3101|nr:tellurite resistance TerB family protein [Vibrio cholerae]
MVKCIGSALKNSWHPDYIDEESRVVLYYQPNKDEEFMFGLFKKKAAQAKATLHKVENRDLMEAIVAGAVLVAFADGDCGNDELTKLQGIIESNDNLAHFGSEIGATIEKYSRMFESGARLAKVKLMKELEDVKGDEKQKEEAFIIAIEIADADGNIDENELKVLKEIGRAFGLNPDNYI